MLSITADFKNHAQRAYRASVPEINTRIRNKKSESIQIPIQQSKMRICCRKKKKTSEQYSNQGKKKKKKKNQKNISARLTDPQKP